MPELEQRPGPPDDVVLLQRARVVDRLAGSAWHELAQPLNGLTGLVSLLKAEGWTANELGVDPSLIAEAVATIRQLAHAFTDLGRGSERPVGLRVLVEETLALAGQQLVDVVVDNEVPIDAPEPDLGLATLRLVTASLVLDAVEALGGPAAARGRLRFSVAPGAEPGSGTAEPYGGTSAVRLVVEDDGRPGGAEDIDLLAAMMAGAGGALQYEQPPGGGNRATLGLPVLRTAEPAGVPAPAAAAPPMTVLVCDDDPVVVDLLVRLLAGAGIRVLRASSGPEALEIVGHEAVDAILADQQMAGMSGRALHAALASSHPDLARRFVLMTGDPGDADLVVFAQTHGLTVLGKPFQTRSLVGLLREVGRR